MKRSAVRTLEKKVRFSLSEKKKDDAMANYKTFCSLIDKAAKKNILHPNKASRKKSRLAGFLKKAFSSPTEAGVAARTTE